MNTGSLLNIKTPSALIELSRVRLNTERMANRAHRLGVALRPHVKTHKCVEVGQLQIASHFGGITVSTLAEAEAFARAGFGDVTYAIPLAPGKAKRVVELSQVIPRFQVLVDHPTAVSALAKAAELAATAISVLIKLDCGYGRAGVSPDDPMLIELARTIQAEATLCFEGILAHGGHSYGCTGADAIKVVAESERAETVRAAEILRHAGISVHVVSVGSTPTACHVEDLTGVTEMRPGNYALFDMYQANIGSCKPGDIALSVLTEVIGVYPERDLILVDAGALALSKDPGATHVESQSLYGAICDLNLKQISGLSLTSLSQEHGKIMVGEGFTGPLPEPGERLRILPNHSCLVTALYDALLVVDEGDVVDRWHPVRGW